MPFELEMAADDDLETTWSVYIYVGLEDYPDYYLEIFDYLTIYLGHPCLVGNEHLMEIDREVVPATLNIVDLFTGELDDGSFWTDDNTWLTDWYTLTDSHSVETGIENACGAPVIVATTEEELGVIQWGDLDG